MAVDISESPGQQATRREVLHTICGGPLWGLFVVLGLEIFGASLTIPVFSFFCIVELHLDATSVGVLLASFNLAQGLGAPTFGRISDGCGRRLILLTCFAWSSCCFAATAFVHSFWDLLAVRTLAGLSGGSIPVAAAMIMDCTTQRERPVALGAKGAFLGAVFTLGPLLVVVMLWQDVARRSIFLLAGFFCAFGFLIGIFILKESLPAEKRRPLFGGNSNGLLAGITDDWRYVRSPLVCAWLARFFYNFAVFSLYSTYSFLIRDNFGWSDHEFGVILAIAGVSQGLMELLLYPTVNEHVGEHWVCVVGLVIFGTSFVFFPYRIAWVHLGALTVFQVGQSICDPSIVNLTGVHAPSERHMGFAQGVSNGFRAMASVTGPVVAGRLYDVNPYWTYSLAAAMSVVSACCVFMVIILVGTFPTASAAEKQMLMEAGSREAGLPKGER